MKFLPDEKLYTDTEHCLRFLQGLDIPSPSTPPAARERFHLYWYGPFSLKLAFAVKSFLATQDLDATELWLWLDTETGYEGHEQSSFLEPLLPFVQVQPFDPEAEVRGTPFEERPELRGGRLAARSDFVRLAVLHNHGGTYVDADVMFLRDFRSLLWNARFAGEFCYRWSSHQTHANTAVLRLDAGSPAAQRLMERCAELSSCHPRTVFEFDANGALDLQVLPCFFFDPLWPTFDRRDHYRGAPFSRFEDFFREFGPGHRRRRGIRSYRAFFPGALTYHWHNQWDAQEHERSYFGLFNREFDEILEARLGVPSAR